MPTTVAPNIDLSNYVTTSTLTNQLSNYSLTTHNHNGVYATASHTHSNYASTSHTHSNYLTSSSVSSYIKTVTGTFSGQGNINLGFKPMLVIIGATSKTYNEDGGARDVIICTRGSSVGVGGSPCYGNNKITSTGFNLDGLQIVTSSYSYTYVAFKP